MSGELADDPLARAVLRHLAGTRGTDDPLGSLAKSVLSGEATLRQAAQNSWHGQGLADAASTAIEAQKDLTPELRATIEADVARLRDPHANHPETREP